MTRHTITSNIQYILYFYFIFLFYIFACIFINILRIFIYFYLLVCLVYTRVRYKKDCIFYFYNLPSLNSFKSSRVNGSPIAYMCFGGISVGKNRERRCGSELLEDRWSEGMGTTGISRESFGRAISSYVLYTVVSPIDAKSTPNI